MRWAWRCQTSSVTCDSTVVVLDTRVQLRLRLSDVLMDLRAEDLFAAHWTENIDDEFLRNMVKVYGIDPTKAEARLRAMKARRPEWEVAMSSADFDAARSKSTRKTATLRPRR